MENTMSNLNEEFISEEIDRVLADYPEYPYKQTFANPGLRKTLVNHVLTQIRTEITEIEGEESVSPIADSAPFPQDQKLALNNLIRQEIAYLIQQKNECVMHSAPEDVDSCLSPSHWFG